MDWSNDYVVVAMVKKTTKSECSEEIGHNVEWNNAYTRFYELADVVYSAASPEKRAFYDKYPADFARRVIKKGENEDLFFDGGDDIDYMQPWYITDAEMGSDNSPQVSIEYEENVNDSKGTNLFAKGLRKL